MPAGSKAVLSGRRIRSGVRKSSNSAPADYEHYRFSFPELLRLLLIPFAVAILTALVFYDSVLAVPFLLVPGLILFLKLKKKQRIEKRKEELKKEFLTAAALLGDYLRSGYSAENALLRSGNELAAVHGEESDIVREWQRMAGGLGLNQSVEEVFRSFGERSGIPEIRDFSEIFGIVKRSSGQLGDVIGAVTGQLTEQFRAEEQIRTMLSARKLELRIMDGIPLFILVYVRFASPELLRVMYETLAGRLVMTLCLIVYLFAVFLAERILRIRVE